MAANRTLVLIPSFTAVIKSENIRFFCRLSSGTSELNQRDYMGISTWPQMISDINSLNCFNKTFCICLKFWTLWTAMLSSQVNFPTLSRSVDLFSCLLSLHTCYDQSVVSVRWLLWITLTCLGSTEENGNILEVYLHHGKQADKVHTNILWIS